MEILLLTQVVPYPPDSGPKIKTYNLLRYLSMRHKVHLLSFARNDQEDSNAVVLNRYCATVTTVRLRRSRVRDIGYLLQSLVTGRPFLIERDDSIEMRETIQRIGARFAFDAVHADQLSMAQFAAALPFPLRVLDEHNAVWSIVRRSGWSQGLRPKRLLAEIEWRKLRRYEGKICGEFDRVLVVSAEDRAGLEQAAGGPLASSVIPIAVDVEQLAFRGSSPAASDIVSVATMFYPPNIEGVRWFARDVFPLIRQSEPDATFHLVGSRPPPDIVKLGSPGSGIDVTGYVADLDPIFSRSRVLVVPLHSGSGMRVKILEAFARGIPVVSTTIGVEGIDANPGEHLLVADTPRAFADAVLRLLRNSDEAWRLAQNGRALVEARYDWRTALSALDDVYLPPVPATDPGPLTAANEIGGNE